MNSDTTGIRVNHLQKSFSQGRVQACRDVNLDIAPGELLVLLGPSGCGKTTTLRCIAGLEQPDNPDAIFVGGVNVTAVPPKDRNLAFVFQDTALFPHLNVRRNISFGLDMRKSFPREEIARRVESAARLLQVDHLLERKSSQLSGGQGQRVALGRAIVMEPAAFLLDEPLAALDAALRVEMRSEIKQIQRALKTTMIFVTHDQEEALSLGDRIAVMHEGVVQQVDTPHNIYLRPVNLFVAGFIGSPAVNLFRGRLVTKKGKTRFEGDGIDVPLPGKLTARIAKSGVGASGEITLAVRPEFVAVGGKRTDLPGRVSLVEMLGSRSIVSAESEGREIRVAVPGESNLKEGEQIKLTLDLERAFYFGADGNSLLE